jgi:hypothetical protein
LRGRQIAPVSPLSCRRPDFGLELLTWGHMAKDTHSLDNCSRDLEFLGQHVKLTIGI